MILNRPLFRQAGGPVMPPQQAMPVAPPSMPPPPPAPAPEEMVQQVEADAGMEGEQLGLEYLRTTNMALDGAENYEEMINAIRGNQAPIEQRYQELAEYVGPEDAGSTPESVLTLVQPTILMTEEGAIDSGIGELMSQVAGPQGQEMGPQMTQGLGELMAAGQPEMPVPVQNFQQGSGPGGVRSPRAYMEEYLPLYEEIMGSSEEADRRRLNLDIASAGFNLASGRDPRTGENIAGRPFLSQLGTALDPIAKGQGERIAAQRQADQAARLAALQSGLSARESDMALLTEAAKAQRDRRIDLKELTFDLAGNKVRTYIDGNDPASLNLVQTLNNPKITDLSSQADAPKPSPHLAINKDGSYSLVDLSTGAEVQSTQEAMDRGDVVDLIQIGSANQQKTPKWFNVTDSQGNSRVLNLNDEAHQNQLDTMQKEGRVTVEGVGTQQTSTTADVYEMTLTDGSSINLDLNNPDDRKKWNQLNEDKQIDLMFTVGARPTAQRPQFENVKVTTIGGEELFLNLVEDKDDATFKRLQRDGTIAQVENIGTASGQPVTRSTWVMQKSGRPTVVTSFDGGTTYQTSEGQVALPNDATEATGDAARTIQEINQMQDDAANEPRTLLEVIEQAADDDVLNDPEMASRFSAQAQLDPNLSPDQKTEQRKTARRDANAWDAVMEGTGIWAQMKKATRAAFALGEILPEDFEGAFLGTVEAGHYLRLIERLSKSAFILSPRFPVAEQEQVTQLFPNPNEIFTGKKDQMAKLKNLVKIMEEVKEINLNAMRTERDITELRNFKKSNQEIDRLFHLIGAPPPEEALTSEERQTIYDAAKIN